MLGSTCCRTIYWFRLTFCSGKILWTFDCLATEKPRNNVHPKTQSTTSHRLRMRLERMYRWSNACARRAPTHAHTYPHALVPYSHTHAQRTHRVIHADIPTTYRRRRTTGTRSRAFVHRATARARTRKVFKTRTSQRITNSWPRVVVDNAPYPANSIRAPGANASRSSRFTVCSNSVQCVEWFGFGIATNYRTTPSICGLHSVERPWRWVQCHWYSG